MFFVEPGDVQVPAGSRHIVIGKLRRGLGIPAFVDKIPASDTNSVPVVFGLGRVPVIAIAKAPGHLGLEEGVKELVIVFPHDFRRGGGEGLIPGFGKDLGEVEGKLGHIIV